METTLPIEKRTSNGTSVTRPARTPSSFCMTTAPVRRATAEEETIGGALQERTTRASGGAEKPAADAARPSIKQGRSIFARVARGEGWALERKRLGGARQPVDSAWELRRLRRPGERGAEGEPTWAG
eukprot:scaffold7018_cov120-Isochrysis_galbana.AAC.4